MSLINSPSRVVRKVGMVSLGCAKNLVDAEIMLGDAGSRGFQITADPEEADVLIVNTCGFIDAAKQESIDAILEANEQLEASGRPGRKLVVSGCLSQRFSKDLVQEIPEVDAFIGLDQVAQAGEILDGLFKEEEAMGNRSDKPLNFVTRGSRYIPDWDTPKFRLTPTHTTYVKIAEGCNHPCSFCVIPQMRGRHRSRSIESVVEEVRRLAGEGVKEFNLISQDTTYFGMDLWEQKSSPTQPVDSSRGPTLTRLLDALAGVEGDFWVRLLYTHPAHWSGELISAIAGNPKVLPYIDIPLQHIHAEMLQTMRRETSREHIENLLDSLRAGIPNLGIRTTFIVGFPGETDEHFESLMEFIEARRFERLGIFTYSQEEGSRAGKMEGQISASIKNRRYRQAMKLQQKIAAEIAAEQVGKRLRILMDQPRVGRTLHDAPDVDCRVILDKDASVGDFLDVEVTGTQVYDLRAQAVLR
ncbi:MAG: 30S ribosomal protein S12 methylthiotransferase RimO [Chthoniobacterales bacterium]